LHKYYNNVFIKQISDSKEVARVRFTKIHTLFLYITAFSLIIACGGGSNGGKDSSNPPSALTYSTSSAVYTQNKEIKDNAPSVTGNVTSWSITPSLPNGLSFDSATGIITGTPLISQNTTYYLITAENDYGSTSENISITINHAAPSALTYSTTSAVYTLDSVISNNVPAYSGTVTSWSITPSLPDGLYFDPATGIISGNPDVEQNAVNYKITATNSGGSTTADISITVNSAAPSALTYSTTSAVYTLDSVIPNNIPTYTGTVTSWSITPSLPNGLLMSKTTGIISGTPDVEQNAVNYKISASNSGGSTTADISITVNSAAPAALTYNATSAVYTQGSVITNNIPSYSGTVTSWTITPTLPKGLLINTTTGIISGIPEVSQNAVNYIVKATNSGGSTTTNISITINSAAPAALTYSTTPAVYTQGAVITNNVPAYTGTVTSWSITPSLPAGLSFDITTGIISGTPAGTLSLTNYKITAANQYGSVEANLSITVNYSPPANLTYSTAAAVYTQGSVIVNNVPAYTGTVTSWSVSPELPTGLTMNTQTGIISGIPYYKWNLTNYAITASNSGGSTTASISITINSGIPVNLTYPTIAALYTNGEPITNNVPAVDGSITSWSVTPSLPNGLIMSTTTGIISGTPSLTQSLKEYTVTAKNQYGSATIKISITVPPVLIITAGHYKDSNGKTIPCFWKNSNRTDLPVENGADGYATSLYVSGETIYTAGYYITGTTYTPCYWTGTTRTDLPAGNYSVTPESIYIADNKLYVTASSYYWTDNTKTDVTVESGERVSSIHVSGGIVYKVGSYYDTASSHYLPCYWIGSTRKSLERDETLQNGDAYLISVKQNSLYSAGNSSPYRICFWSPDTSRTELRMDDVWSPSPSVNSIFVSKSGTVYTGGWYEDIYDTITPCYWKESARTDLPCNYNAYVRSIYESGGTVYTAGYYYNSYNKKYTPCIWIDSNQYKLTGDGGWASAVYVQ